MGKLSAVRRPGGTDVARRSHRAAAPLPGGSVRARHPRRELDRGKNPHRYSRRSQNSDLDHVRCRRLQRSSRRAHPPALIPRARSTLVKNLRGARAILFGLRGHERSSPSSSARRARQRSRTGQGLISHPDEVALVRIKRLTLAANTRSGQRLRNFDLMAAPAERPLIDGLQLQVGIQRAGPMDGVPYVTQQLVQPAGHSGTSSHCSRTDAIDPAAGSNTRSSPRTASAPRLRSARSTAVVVACDSHVDM